MANFQILLDKGEMTFNGNNRRKRLWFLNVAHAAILDFVKCNVCPIVSHKRSSAS